MFEKYFGWLGKLPQWLASIVLVLSFVICLIPGVLISDLIRRPEREEIYQQGYDSGYDEGHSDGYGEGLDEGYSDGYDDGYDAGHDEAYDDAYEEGRMDGYTTGYDDGYGDGYDEGQDNAYDSGYDDGYDEGYEDGWQAYSEAEGDDFLLWLHSPSSGSDLSGPLSQEDQLSRSEEAASPTSYIGNLKSHVFHRTTCSSLPAQGNRITFPTRQAAIDGGYHACSKCHP